MIVKNNKFPRILLVLMAKIKAEEAVNLLVRTQLSDWPKDFLAQIYSGETTGSGEFCGQYYQLQGCDRFLGSLFGRLRGGVAEMVAVEGVKRSSSYHSSGPLQRMMKILKKHIGDKLIGSGLWEVIFRIRLSKPIEDFVKNFKPDIIYCQGYSLGFSTLPLLIARRFNLPICFQTTDDWPSYTYNYFPMGWLLRRRVRELVSEAKVRMAFGEKMRRMYESRYGVNFVGSYHLDDPRRFQVQEDSGMGTEPFRVVYTGSIGLRRYEAVQDLLNVVRTHQLYMRPIQIVVYCSGLPKDIPCELLDAPEVTFLPLPTHDDLPRILASASVLFLPESFNVAPELIEYAISSKAHLYMMSGRPILVYGPAYSGTVEYAIHGGWGLVVTVQSPIKLKGALVKMLDGGGRMHHQLQCNAEACIQRYHDLAAGQKRFREMLVSAVHSGDAAK